MPKRAVIISGGKITDYKYIKSQIKSTDTIICADSGYAHAVSMGVTPSIVVGDLDSVGEIPDGVFVLRYPQKKDLTDTEIAIEYAREKGFNEFLFLAATGGRMDHCLTNILLLKSFLPGNKNAAIIDEYNKIMITDSRLQLCEPCGSLVSLVPLTDCQGVSTKNLEYPLHDADMYVGKGLGVSNVMIADNAEVTVKNGILFVIVARD
ncbi:MAG: thiamine diphosphokinase [Defluviitaleaceae bacterium]|nr:thiamine diphosphokinase [Defluviitaleaceae bacterium]